MKVNQTIDGVPRELVEWAYSLSCAMGYRSDPRRVELRALLDSGECCHEFVPFQANCTKCGIPYKPAAQPQGEPVAWRFRWDYDHGNGWCRNAVRFVESMEHVEHEDKSTWRDITPLYAEQPAPVALTQDAIDRIVPSLNPEPDRDEFHCEWALWSDRERIRNKLSTLLTANPAPVAVVMPERLAMTGRGLMDAPTVNHHIGWNACLDEVTRLNTK